MGLFRRSSGGGVLLLLLCVAGVTYGQSVDDAIRVSRQGLTFDARSLGMGNAASTIGYDYSALRFNPATLALTEHSTYTMSVNTNSFGNTSMFYGTETKFATSNTSLNQAGFSFPIRLDSTRRAVFGLGYTQSKDFNLGLKYQGFNLGDSSFVQRLAGKNDPLARALGLTYATYDSAGDYVGDRTVLGGGMYESGYLLETGNLLHVTGGASFEAISGVYFGVSGSYNVGFVNSDLELTASDTADTYGLNIRTNPGDPRTAGFTGTTYRNVVSKEYTGWDIRFGLLYKLENFIAVSASFKVPMPHTVSETRYLIGRSRFATGASLDVQSPSTSSSFRFAPPYEATVGAMVNLWILTGTAEATYVDYSQMEISSGFELPDRMTMNKQIKDQFTQVLNLNAGAEFRLPFTGISARAGFMYRPSPYKGDPMRYDQKFVTLGAGINSSDQVMFDIGYGYGWQGEKRVESSSVEKKDVEQTVTYQTLVATVKFVF